MASEAKNPTDLPRAILWTLAIVTIFYALASISLVGMLPFEEISATSGFPDAFAARGYVWASQITAAGEVITLPVGEFFQFLLHLSLLLFFRPLTRSVF